MTGGSARRAAAARTRAYHINFDLVPLGIGEIYRQRVAVSGLADRRDALVPDPAEDFLQLVEIAHLERQPGTDRGAHEFLLKLNPAGIDRAIQSGKSKNLHQPLGLMSPFTTSQERGLRNRLQAAQVSPFFGWS